VIAAGWVEMTEGPDARSRMVRITDTGRELRRNAQRRWKAAQLSLNEKLGETTVAALHTLLDRGLAAFHDSETPED
jgi:DNA-binding MarR family transcriptional regulator